MNKLTLLLLLVTQLSFAQTNPVLETISIIEFKEDTIKSVFDWIADNIEYDIKKFNEIKTGPTTIRNSNFKNEKEYRDFLLSKVVKYRKGVCEDYSLLFDAVVRELGFESYIIEGYTKKGDEKVYRSLGHTWNAVKVDNIWKLYDPTWGAGYVENGKKFVKNYNQEWYDVDSEEMIKTHMPLDPIWQLTNSPMSYLSFEKNLRNIESEVNFNYEELIQKHGEKEKKEQMQDQITRSIEMGEGIRLIEEWRKRMTKSIGLYGITSQQDLLEEANENSNRAVDLFNEYIAAKNKRFKGKKWTLVSAKQNIEEALEEVQSAIGIYKSIDVEDKRANYSLENAIRHSEKLLNAINEELIFLAKFASK